jgi:hypothetical protein
MMAMSFSHLIIRDAIFYRMGIVLFFILNYSQNEVKKLFVMRIASSFYLPTNRWHKLTSSTTSILQRVFHGALMRASGGPPISSYYYWWTPISSYYYWWTETARVAMRKK